jgi:ferrous iron transport protein A
MDQAKPRPLSLVQAGQTVRIAAINAGYGLRVRLVSMGLLPNVEVTVIKHGRPGPFVVAVKGSKVVLGKGMADKIMVT